MKSTFALYNLDPSSLRKLPYEEALEAKIDGAQFAMRQYNKLAKKELGINQEKYEELLEKYRASEKSIKFNRELLEELDSF